MAITNIYQDLIMNPENMPNRLQNLEMFPPVDNIPSRIDFTAGDELVPGMGEPAINFKDAPVPFGLRKNNPFRGPIDSFILSRGNPNNNIINRTKSAISSGIGKGFDLGKAAIGGIASLVTGIPGIGLVLNAFGPMTEEEKAMRDFYGSEFGLTDTGQVASGIMQGYNPVSMFGSAGLTNAIDKRMATIKNTLQKKKSVALENRLKELQRIKEAEEKARRSAVDRMFQEGRGGRGQDFTGGRFDRARSRAEYDRDPTGFSGSS